MTNEKFELNYIVGLVDYRNKTWAHNHLLKMTKDEQFEFNCESDKAFKQNFGDNHD